MLALFKESPNEAITIEPLIWARNKWRKALDKSQIIDREELEIAWRIDYPGHPTPDFSEWLSGFDLNWIFSHIDKQVREIFCHHVDLIEAVGTHRKIIKTPLCGEDWELWVETIATQIKLDFNYTHPCGSAFLDYKGSQWRVTLLHGSIVPNGKPKAFFRQIAREAYLLADFGLEIESQDLLLKLIEKKENILIAGSTGSGKTSLLSSLLSFINFEDHVVLLEDTQEISCVAPRVTRMLASKQAGRSLSDYLAHALRLSPDRIIVGEMRSHEVIPYLLAMNTGHKGLISTIHASSAMDAILRVAQLFVLASGQKDISYQEVLKLVARNVGYVVFVEQRKITQVIKVFGSEGDMPLYDVLLENLQTHYK